MMILGGPLKIMFVTTHIAIRDLADVLTIPKISKAIRLALSFAKPGDVVLVSGKGHESYQVIGDRVISFDDKEVVKEVLAEGFSR